MAARQCCRPGGYREPIRSSKAGVHTWEPDMTYPIQAASLDRIQATLAKDVPIFMLNLLRFRPNGGRETYFGRYIAAFRQITAEQGIEGIAPIWTGDVAGFVAGPDAEAWDAVLMVSYPTIDAFRAIVDSEAYRTRAAPHREAALLDWRLIAQTEMPRP